MYVESEWNDSIERAAKIKSNYYRLPQVIPSCEQWNSNIEGHNHYLERMKRSINIKNNI